jgi:competence protein ComEC
MFHFHQFPVYFLFTNLLAVPLSSLVVLLEIGLCIVSALPAIAAPLGQLIYWLIATMNHFISYMDQLPFSVWSGMQINVWQALLLYGLIAALCSWVVSKRRAAFFTALGCVLAFFTLRSISFINAGRQQSLVVYNIPKHRAMHFISGRQSVLLGDVQEPRDRLLMEPQLLPARILYRVKEVAALESLSGNGPVYFFNNRKIVLIDRNNAFPLLQQPIKTDLIILSGNAPVTLASLAKTFSCTQVIADASNTPAKVHKWKEEAAKLGLHCVSVVDNGAFVMNMD